MKIRDRRIDSGKPFDWGRTSKDYAKYRDIYPDEFYRRIIDRGLCIKGQKVLDLATGTGVLPRNLYRFGAEWTGTDISPEQIAQAEILADAGGMKIHFQTVSAEDLQFPDESFDVITACCMAACYMTACCMAACCKAARCAGVRNVTAQESAGSGPSISPCGNRLP